MYTIAHTVQTDWKDRLQCSYQFVCISSSDNQIFQSFVFSIFSIVVCCLNCIRCCLYSHLFTVVLEQST